jgi:hypothetical protein
MEPRFDRPAFSIEQLAGDAGEIAVEVLHDQLEGMFWKKTHFKLPALAFDRVRWHLERLVALAEPTRV